MTPEPIEWKLDIARMMTDLPAQYRLILLLRDIEGLSLGELGHQLQLSLPATKSRLHRARLLARKRLAPPGGELDPDEISS